MKKVLAIVLAIVMLAGLATVAFAEGSPVGDVKVSITITLMLGNTKETLPVIEVNDGDSYTITAPEREGYTFEKMTIEGEFTEAKRQTKEYTVPSVTITPESDITVVITYKATGGGSGSGDSGDTSPDTGVDFTVGILAVLMGLFGVAIATKKLFEK